MTLWLNVEEQRTDWIKKLDQPTLQGSLTVDEGIVRKSLTSSSCPVLELRKEGSSSSMSAVIILNDCDSKAKVLCTLDLFKPTKAENQPNLACLRPLQMTSKSGEEATRRRKRDTNVKKDVQLELSRNGKMSVNMIYIPY